MRAGGKRCRKPVCEVRGKRGSKPKTALLPLPYQMRLLKAKAQVLTPGSGSRDVPYIKGLQAHERAVIRWANADWFTAS